MTTTAKRESSKVTEGNRQQKTGEEGRANTHDVLLSLSLVWRKGEGNDRIVIPLPVRVQEPSQPLNLGGEIHDDDLHLDVQVKLEDF